MLAIKIVLETTDAQQGNTFIAHNKSCVHTATAAVFTQLQALVLTGACLQLVTGKLQWRKAVGQNLHNLSMTT